MLQAPQLSARYTVDRSRLTLVWTLIALALLDLGVGFAFQLPLDPRIKASGFQRYFDYGRSVEGKLRNMFGVDDQHSAPILFAGWLDEICTKSEPPPPGKLGANIYGNSFSGQLAEQLELLDSAISVARYLGPGAGPNHSYGCFTRLDARRLDRQRPVQIFGITSLSLPRMVGIWGVTTSFEYPQPFTYPRYRLSLEGGLEAHEPSVRSATDLHRVLSNPALWNAWLDEVKGQDAFFAEDLMWADWRDRSVLGRMTRRAFGQYLVRKEFERLRGEDGLVKAPEIVDVLPVMIREFASRTRSIGGRPIVVLFEERGHAGELDRILAQRSAALIACLSAKNESALTPTSHHFRSW